MTLDETKKIVLGIMTMFPNFRVESKEFVTKMWHSALADKQYSDVEAALMCYIREDQSGFAPSPGQLMKFMPKAEVEEYPPAAEIWARVDKMLHRASTLEEKDFKELPEPAQKAIGSLFVLKEWGITETRVVESVIAPSFMNRYREMCELDADRKAIAKAQALLESRTSARIEGKDV